MNPLLLFCTDESVSNCRRWIESNYPGETIGYCTLPLKMDEAHCWMLDAERTPQAAVIQSFSKMGIIAEPRIIPGAPLSVYVPPQAAARARAALRN